jgi:hypothetical protein
MLVYKMNKITLSGKINISFPKNILCIYSIEGFVAVIVSTLYVCSPTC